METPDKGLKVVDVFSAFESRFGRLSARDQSIYWETCPSGWNRKEDAENRLIAEPAPIGTDRLGGQRYKYPEKSYRYKYDLGHTIVMCCCIIVSIDVHSVRERERGRCLTM